MTATAGGAGTTAGAAGSQRGGGSALADRFGIRPGQVVQEVGHGDDVDSELLAAVVERAGTELVSEEAGDLVDAVDVVLLWWRSTDGDLVDALVDSITLLASGGVVWLLTPKAGRPGHIEPSDITEAAPTAGLSQTSSVNAGRDWAGARLVAPKSGRKVR